MRSALAERLARRLGATGRDYPTVDDLHANPCAAKPAGTMSDIVLLPPAREAPAALPESSRRRSVPELLWRAFEILFAGSMLILTLPIMIAIGIYIRLDTPGPALFWQRRLGAGAVPFRFVKFRTLYADARERFPELYAYEYSAEELETLRFKVEDDPRVTPGGDWLRRTSLDELPNLWNVLTGEMSLVGPRPEIPEMLPYYTGWMREKFAVRPGVTGPAQVSGRGRLSFRATVGLDVDYVRHRSVKRDVKILFRTAWLVLKRDGAF